jgi:hypothetical protein
MFQFLRVSAAASYLFFFFFIQPDERCVASIRPHPAADIRQE